MCEKLCVPVEANVELTLAAGGADNAALVAAEAHVPQPVAAAEAGLTARRANDDKRKPLVFVDLAAPTGQPVELFVEGPTAEWALPIPKPAQGAPPGHAHFGFELDGLPPGVDPKGPFELTFTIVKGGRRHRGQDPSRLIRRRAILASHKTSGEETHAHQSRRQAAQRNVPRDDRGRAHKPKTTDDIFKGKKVALFAVPGAFTPTCNNLHIPSFLNNVDAFKAKGVDTIAVTGVNDVFVMEAWKKSTGAAGKIDFLADGNGEFAKAIDMAFDGSGNGLGTRSKRYSMLVDDGVVKTLNIEDAPGKCDISGGQALLAQI